MKTQFHKHRRDLFWIAVISGLMLLPGFAVSQCKHARSKCPIDSVKVPMVKASREGAKIIKVDSTDKIISIRALNTLYDTARAYEIIAVKLRTNKPIKAFTHLFVDGILIKDLAPWKTSECDKTVFFKLGLPVQYVLASFIANQSKGSDIIPVFLSVGDAKGNCMVTSVDPIYMEVRKTKDYSWMVTAGISIALIILIVLSLQNHILKDDSNKYYSLGRSQLFYWTIIFSFCYLYIWFSAQSMPDVTSSALIILGISAATTAAAKTIENDNNQKPEFRNAVKLPSQGWLKDILSDDNSMSIHRFQSVVFNLVFGVIFIERAITAFRMPTFDNNVLLLMGISSGTYAGLKIAEKPDPIVNAGPPNPVNPPNP